MAPAERLVIGDAQRRKGLVEVEVEPVDGDIQVAPEHERHDRGGEDPVVEEHGGVVDQRVVARQGVHAVLADLATCHGHDLGKSRY